jgi:hypothetical protein
MRLSNLLGAILFALLAMVLIFLLGHAGWAWVESLFLR